MAQHFSYNFEWDPLKALSNIAKHSVSFEQASSVFQDQLALSIFDKKHSGEEERWVLLGLAENSLLLVVVHTIKDTTTDSTLIRIISARKATQNERKQYEENTYGK